MPEPSPGFALPASLDDIDPAFMTAVLRRSGAISPSNAVVSQVDSGVGMTAGYFSAIKKVHCTYREPTDAPDKFVVKAWPPLELAPKGNIQAMFIKDIKGYQLPASMFYPRPKTHLAAYDAPNDLWALVMEDADCFAEHKVHEAELTFDEVMGMIPGLVDVAVAWEGCDVGEKADQLAEIGVELWTSPANLGQYKAAMPSGAKFFDKVTCLADSSLVSGRPWDREVGAGVAELFTRRLEAFYAPARPENGATCTLAHGDLRGDNIFFCPDRSRVPTGWLCIDFQLMFRGPVPSDLAYLMGSGSVLPEVYRGENLQTILRAFYDQFMARTRRYPNYTYAQFVDEYAMMSPVEFLYYVAFGPAITHAGAFNNQLGMRIELGGQGATEADLPPEEIRQRMWWRKTFANVSANLKTFGLYQRLQGLPDNLEGLGPWMDLPDHLR
jgi:hypothetical protein